MNDARRQRFGQGPGLGDYVVVALPGRPCEGKYSFAGTLVSSVPFFPKRDHRLRYGEGAEVAPR